jgi:hypothetical protein
MKGKEGRKDEERKGGVEEGRMEAKQSKKVMDGGGQQRGRKIF